MLQIKNLRLLRGKNLVLQDFSRALSAGQGAWLTGLNGSGKTSLLRAIAGLLPVLDGAIIIDAHKIFVGMRGGHDAVLTVRENLEFWCAINKARILDVRAPLAIAGLQAVQDRQAGELSAGQSQRLALSRLLCSDAKLWLLDEPFSALDAAGQIWLEGMMAKHLAQGGAIVCATHHAHDVADMQGWAL